jgi:hypothetical protein
MKPKPPAKQPSKQRPQAGSGEHVVTLASDSIGKAFATTDMVFVNGLTTQVVNVASHGRQPDEKATAYVLAMMRGIGPRDPVEALLAAQMAATHNAVMTFARRLAHVETIPQQDSAERALSKLQRTFVAQMEALKRYRSNGSQKMTVEHVHVHEGGQAIVGNVSEGRATVLLVKPFAMVFGLAGWR